MSPFSRWGIEWRKDTVLGFVILLMVLMLTAFICTRAMVSAIRQTADAQLQVIQLHLNDSNESQVLILQTLKNIESRETNLEQKVNTREDVIRRLELQIRKMQPEKSRQ